MNRAMSPKYFICLFRLSAHFQCAFVRFNLLWSLPASDCIFPLFSFRSTDYGSTYERMNDKVGSKTVLSYLYVCPTNKRKVRCRKEFFSLIHYLLFPYCSFLIAIKVLSTWLYISCRCFAFKASNGIIPPVLAVDWTLHCDIRHEGKNKKNREKDTELFY